MLKLDGIASFAAIAESGSISEAARRLHLSKSIVSERLADLERSLGAALLHRTTRKLSLTEDGNAFLERATRILREVEDAASDMAERRGSLAGPLRIAAPVVTSGRRWEKHGVMRTILLMWWLRLAYFLCANPTWLARSYGYVPRQS